jgi:hypothetical protein
MGVKENALNIARTAKSFAQSAMSFIHNAMTRHIYDVLQCDLQWALPTMQ